MSFWVYRAAGRESAPVTIEALQGLIRRGSLPADAEVREAGGSGRWKPISTTDFQKLLPAVPQRSAPSENRLGRILLFAVIGGMAGYWLLGPKAGFSDADIKAAKIAIQREFEKRDGLTVVQVDLVRETRTKLFGIVKLRIKALDLEMTKGCTATMADDGVQYLWKCE